MIETDVEQVKHRTIHLKKINRGNKQTVEKMYEKMLLVKPMKT